MNKVMNRKILIFSAVLFFALFSGSCGDSEETVTPPESLEVDKQIISLDNKESYGLLGIKSNTKWTVSSSDTWLTCSSASGEGNQILRVTATSNDGSKIVRTATVTVTSESGVSKLVQVSQDRIPFAYVDLDRTQWYAAPETDLDGIPLENVNFGTNPGTANATTGTLITNKIKSPYLSHFLPWNAGAPSATTSDALNSPIAHFDNKSETYLSMVKGIGIDATLSDPTLHVNGGVIITEENEKPWFIIRLHETQPQKFNYFRIRYRENGSNAASLKPQGITFFGSNDNSCITDDTKWTQINDEVIVPPASLDNSTQPAATDMGIFAPGANLESGNVILPVTCEYQYVKVRYDLWDVPSNTIQIAEFWIGLYE